MSRTFRIPDTVLSQELAGETILLNLDTGVYFGLDAVGTRIWQLLHAGRTLDAIREALVAEYDVASDQLEADLTRLVAHLRRERLRLG